MNNIELHGFDEVVRMLDKLPDKLQKQSILKMERKSTKPVITTARANLKSQTKGTGALARSIGNITAKRTKAAIIYVGPRVKGKWKYIGYKAHWIEYGTNKMPARPFMRPAIDGQMGAVKSLFISNMHTYLEGVVNKAVAKLKR